MKRSVWITVERSVLHFSAIYLNPLDHCLLFFPLAFEPKAFFEFLSWLEDRRPAASGSSRYRNT